MRVACTALALGGAVWLLPGLASAQTPLTLADVLARAREQAPRIVSARLALDEARGRMAGASVRRSSNPEVDLNVGNRQGVSPRSTDLQFGVAQALEPPGRRAARMAGATALIDLGTATVDETMRDVLRDAASLFYQAVYATERVRLLAASEQLADTILETADRRFRAGDLAVIDVNLSRASLARARADRRAGEAEQIQAFGALMTLLGTGDPVSVSGPLTAPGPPDRAALLQAVAERPELHALEAAIRDADADVALGRTFSKPAYGMGLRYQREEGNHMVLGGVTISLPVFSSGQELRATGSARATRLRAELEAARTRVRVELQTALAAYEHRAGAVQALERDALPGLDENDSLTMRSFEVGQIGLPDVLVIRREILDTRFQYLSALLEAARARADVDAAAGGLR